MARDSRGVQLLDRFSNHALGGSPADQGYVRIGRPLELGRREVLEGEVHFLHALFRDLATNGGVAENVADQYAFLVVLVGSGDMHGVGRAGNDARGDAGSR